MRQLVFYYDGNSSLSVVRSTLIYELLGECAVHTRRKATYWAMQMPSNPRLHADPCEPHLPSSPHRRSRHALRYGLSRVRDISLGGESNMQASEIHEPSCRASMHQRMMTYVRDNVYSCTSEETRKKLSLSLSSTIHRLWRIAPSSSVSRSLRAGASPLTARWPACSQMPILGNPRKRSRGNVEQVRAATIRADLDSNSHAR